MKLLLVLIFPLISGKIFKKDNCTTPGKFTVHVGNGYGSGSYATNDTVHIFNNSNNEARSFSHWTGDTTLLKTNEWHSWFIMPAHDVKFNAVEIISIKPDLIFEKIKGHSLLKPVYYYFPKHTKGTVFLFHGSGGSASQIAGSFESRYFIRDLINAGYGVIITECEEATLNKDINNDGHKRWNYLPVEKQRNVDYDNIDKLRAEFIRRGSIENYTPLFAIGMSNGGAFSTMVAPALGFKAAISFCAQAPVFLAINKRMPVMYAMQGEDSHQSVGKNGNKKALENSNTLTGSGICSRYFQNPRSPLYPQRFAKHPEISLDLSIQIFDEIKNAGFTDDRNYLKISGRAIGERFRQQPASFPVIRKLTLPQILFVAEQLDCAFADHRMFSDLSKTSIKFLDNQCR